VAYLLLYNVAMAAGWTSIGWAACRETLNKGDLKYVFRATERSLFIFQTAALMEVIHPILGLVKTSVILTLFQVSSRIFLIWGVLSPVPKTQNSYGFIMLLFAWTITEIIRYSYYAFKQVSPKTDIGGDGRDLSPYFLTYLRYTLFIVLYPLGVTGEIMSIIRALPIVKDSDLYSWGLPNSWNISFNYYYILLTILPLYIVIFPQLYSHMFRQRSKILYHVAREDDHDKVQ